MDDLFQRLAAPFPPDRVSWRVGSTTQDKKRGMALAYIDARDVMERFDEVCGPDGWERRHPHVTGTTTCEIGIWVPERDRWVVKTDGAGDTAVEAEKGSLSDSFKRAAVNWGVGRYLYDLESPWVALDQYKKIEAGEHARLRALLTKGAKPAPVGEPVPRASEVAINLLRACNTDKALFAEAWAKNKDGWKAVMYEDEYREVVAEMKRIAATFTEQAVAA